jgi:hypothetical protein
MSNITQTKRFKWMVEVVQGSFEHFLKDSNIGVDDFFKMDKNYTIVSEFLNATGPPKLIIYFQQDAGGQDDLREMTEPHLVFTTGENEKLSGKGVYFLRTVNHKVNLADLEAEVIYGEIKDDTLKQLNSVVSQVFLPLIRTMDDKVDWKQCDDEQKKEFISVTTKFSDELEEGIKSLTDSIDTCKIDQTRVSSGGEFEKSGYYEELFGEWLANFKKKLNDDQEQNKKLNEGPRTELIYWKSRLQDITLLSE